MPRKIIITTIVLGLSVVLAASSRDAHEARSPDARDFPNLDSIVEANMEYGHLIGLQASVIKDGQLIWNNSYGYARLSDSTEVTDTTIFTIASVSKTVTSVALMQMHEAGYFDLDDNINDHLSFEVHNPWYPTDSITPRMLLTHTSSIWDRSSLADTMMLLGDTSMTLRETCQQYLCPGGIWYTMMNFGNYLPGTHCSYCNLGSTLWAHLVEAASGSPDGYFVQHCEDSIFTPLNMTRTCWLMCDVDTNQMAMPYFTAGSPNPIGYFSWPIYPAASLKTTAIELANFLIAFQNHGQFGTVNILDSTTVELMTTVQYPSVTSEWGLGWWHIIHNGRELWGHHGGPAYGMTCTMWLCEQENSGAIVLATGDYGGYSRNAVLAIADGLFEYALAYGVGELGTEKPTSIQFTSAPNPFAHTTSIQYTLPRKTLVRLNIYNTAGQLVVTLVDATQEAGSYSVSWEGKNLPNGVYICRMETDDCTETQKILLMK
jgi:CubicO group peptidase (beta-lactamase class C family)